MKKSLLALAALSAFAGVAHAESSVELYGVLDLAVGVAGHQGNAAATFPATIDTKDPLATSSGKGSLTGMFNGGISPSRWGLKGSEDLGGGMKATFLLESGFDANSGALNNGIVAQQASGTTVGGTSLNGQLFNRSAWVGLSDATLGEIRLGRQYAPEFDIVVAYDPVQAAQLFSPIGFSGSTGGGGGVTDDLRRDNSIRYTNKVGNFNFGGMYQVKENAGVGSSYALNAGYEAALWGVQAAYQNSKDVVTTNANASGLTAYNSESYMIAAKYKLTDAGTVKAGYQHYKLSAASDSLTGVTTIYGVNFGTSSTSNIGYAGSDQNVNMFWVGGDYNVSTALNVSAGYYNYHYAAYDITKDYTQEFYSLLADYKLSKRTDVYAGLMLSQYSGPKADATSYYNNSVYAVGIRHKF